MSINLLSDICYEHIIDDYWYGLYGDFKLIINKKLNLFNATKLCQSGGKHMKNWLQNKQSKELIEYYRNQMEDLHVSNRFFYTIKGGHNEIYNTIISGTYVRQELILNIALWLSKEFYGKVYRITWSYFANEYSQKYKDQIDQLNMRMAEVEKISARLQLTNQKYQCVEEDISPKILEESKRNTILLFDKCKSGDDYPFCASRIQKRSKSKTIRDLKKKYPNLNILQEIKYNPNAINLFNLAKEKLQNIICRYNDIKLANNYTIEEFTSDLQQLSMEKF